MPPQVFAVPRNAGDLDHHFQGPAHDARQLRRCLEAGADEPVARPPSQPFQSPSGLIDTDAPQLALHFKEGNRFGSAQLRVPI